MHSYHFKLIPVACAVAILAACGGNDNAAAPAVPFASPAMIVPAGAASKSMALSACSSGLQTATFVVNSAGDMIFSGAPAGTTTISELHRINYASATYQSVAGGNNSTGPNASTQLQQASGYIEASVNSTSGYFQSSKSTMPAHFFECTLANGSASFALTTLPSSARLASQMLNGITGITTTQVVSGTFTGGVANWDNWPSSYPAYPLLDDESIRYFSLNLSSGAFSTSPLPNVAGTAYNITLPTTPTSTTAYFNESIEAGTKEFYVNVATPSAGQLTLIIRRIGNLLRPVACGNNYCD